VNKKNLVAIIVLNYNKKNDTLECLDSIFKMDYREFEVVVVDNASTDGSAEAINSEYPAAHLIKNKINLGAIVGRNVGWRFAEKNFDFEYLLFLDDDVIIDKHFVTKLVDLLNTNEQIGIASGKAYTNHKLSTIMSAGIHVNLYTGSIYDIGAGEIDNGQHDQPNYRNACGCFGLIIRKDLFSKLDGFDEIFSPYGWEEVDLCLQAKKLGYKTYYLPDAIIVHKGSRQGRKPNPVYEKSKTKNFFFLLKKNTSLLQKITCAVCLPFWAIIIASKLIFKGNTPIILEHIKGLFQVINNQKSTTKPNNNLEKVQWDRTKRSKLLL